MTLSMFWHRLIMGCWWGHRDVQWELSPSGVYQLRCYHCYRVLQRR